MTSLTNYLVKSSQIFPKLLQRISLQKAEIITILVDRQGKNPKTRANFTVRDLNQALDMIKSYKNKD